MSLITVIDWVPLSTWEVWLTTIDTQRGCPLRP
jgi:hypothetical protein